MAATENHGARTSRPKRLDSSHYEQTLLAAAAEVFETSGVEATIREIAAKADTGLATLYRHFPTRADLIIAVFRKQVDAVAEAGPLLLEDAESPAAALTQWVDVFVDFLVTKHGLAASLHDPKIGRMLIAYFVEHLVPVCETLLVAVTTPRGAAPATDAYLLLRGIGNLCIGAEHDPSYDVQTLVHILIAGVVDTSTTAR